MDILQIENVSFRYPNATDQALCDLSFRVKAGEFVVLCGASGCGKTTLLRLLKRELAPFGEQSGDIRYQGVLQQQMTDRDATTIGYVLQNPDSQIVTDKVWHELAFGLENLGLPTPVIRRRVAEMASYFGIQDWFRRDTDELSGGQKQMLNLASVMVMQPKVLLLDEPTSQLDPIAAAEFIGTLQKLNRELGLTILLVEHRLEDVLPVADKVLLLDAGRMQFYDAPKRLGTFFQNQPHPALAGMPSAMRLFHMLGGTGDCPLTVKQGRELVERYDRRVDHLDPPPYTHSDAMALQMKDVWFRYERDLPDVLRGVSLSVYEGECLCILGGNGTGKTTALRVLSGLNKPYRGTVRIGGKKIGEYTENALYRHNIAALPQNPQSVFLQKTVREDLADICRAMDYPKAEQDAKITSVAERLGIAQLLDRHPYDLSGGEQQKAALAKLLLQQPRILLLDEPTKGMDAASKLVLSALLRDLREQGMTVVIVTHDVEFAAQNADRCALFFDGEIVSVDTPVAFFSANTYYPTAANRMAREWYPQAITCEDVATLCRRNGLADKEDDA